MYITDSRGALDVGLHGEFGFFKKLHKKLNPFKIGKKLFKKDPGIFALKTTMKIFRRKKSKGGGGEEQSASAAQGGGAPMYSAAPMAYNMRSRPAQAQSPMTYDSQSQSDEGAESENSPNGKPAIKMSPLLIGGIAAAALLAFLLLSNKRKGRGK